MKKRYLQSNHDLIEMKDVEIARVKAREIEEKE